MTFSPRLRSFSIVAVALAAVAIPTAVSAQGLFDFLFRPQRRGPPPSASSYADPFPEFSPGRGRRSDPERHAGPSAGPSVVFCVRLCDGRYFPMQRSGGASTAQMCNSFCPAAETRVFSGGGIDHAVARDGTRYANLDNAFAYRERTVADCTCNGRDPYGLVTLSPESDPTLRNGDIVATNEGFVAYNSNRRHAEFMPVQSYPGLSAEWRERLAQTRITPNNATPVSAETIRERASAVHDGRRVQLDR
jgi:hypothetical protein